MTQSHTDRIARMKRGPVRISITLPFRTYSELERTAQAEGRSLSNLSAYLLECALQARAAKPTLPPIDSVQPVLNRLTIPTKRFMVGQ
jgi:hypothetical protein